MAEPIGQCRPSDAASIRFRSVGCWPCVPMRKEARRSASRFDGSREVIAWIRGFEKKFTETYWLRSPLDLRAWHQIAGRRDWQVPGDADDEQRISGPARRTVP